MTRASAAQADLSQRFTALLLCFCLLATSVSAAPSPMATSLILSGLSSRIGHVDESWQGNNGKTIYLIRDAHDSVAAQKNIARLIHYLVQSHGVKTVYEEGYEGEVPTDLFFQDVQDSKTREEVSRKLLEELRIGGAEYAHINRFYSVVSRESWGMSKKKLSQTQDTHTASPNPRLKTQDSRHVDFRLIGADSLRGHLENILDYRHAARAREEILSDLDAIQKQQNQIIAQKFPKTAREWLKLEDRFEKNQLDLAEYLRRSVQIYLRLQGQNRFTQQYPQLTLFVRALDSKNADAVHKARQIQGREFNHELRRFEEDLARQILLENSPEARKDRSNLSTDTLERVFTDYQTVRLARKLTLMELSPSDFTNVQTLLKHFKTHAFAQFAAEQNAKTVVLSRRWEKKIQRAVQFYQTALSREESVAKRLKEFGTNTSETKAVLVFGGFHAPQLKDMLREQGFSYVVVDPVISKISKGDGELYRKLMAGDERLKALPPLLSKMSRVMSDFEWAASGLTTSAVVRREIAQRASLLNYQRLASSVQGEERKINASGDSENIALTQSKWRRLKSKLEQSQLQTWYQFLSFADGLSAHRRPQIKNVTTAIINTILSWRDGILFHTPPITAAIEKAWNRVRQVRESASRRFSVQNAVNELLSLGFIEEQSLRSSGRKPQSGGGRSEVRSTEGASEKKNNPREFIPEESITEVEDARWMEFFSGLIQLGYDVAKLEEVRKLFRQEAESAEGREAYFKMLAQAAAQPAGVMSFAAVLMAVHPLEQWLPLLSQGKFHFNLRELLNLSRQQDGYDDAWKKTKQERVIEGSGIRYTLEMPASFFEDGWYQDAGREIIRFTEEFLSRMAVPGYFNVRVANNIEALRKDPANTSLTSFDNAVLEQLEFSEAEKRMPILQIGRGEDAGVRGMPVSVLDTPVAFVLQPKFAEAVLSLVDSGTEQLNLTDMIEPLWLQEFFKMPGRKMSLRQGSETLASWLTKIEEEIGWLKTQRDEQDLIFVVGTHQRVADISVYSIDDSGEMEKPLYIGHSRRGFDQEKWKTTWEGSSRSEIRMAKSGETVFSSPHEEEVLRGLLLAENKDRLAGAGWAALDADGRMLRQFVYMPSREDILAIHQLHGDFYLRTRFLSRPKKDRKSDVILSIYKSGPHDTKSFQISMLPESSQQELALVKIQSGDVPARVWTVEARGTPAMKIFELPILRISSEEGRLLDAVMKLSRTKIEKLRQKHNLTGGMAVEKILQKAEGSDHVNFTIAVRTDVVPVNRFYFPASVQGSMARVVLDKNAVVEKLFLDGREMPLIHVLDPQGNLMMTGQWYSEKTLRKLSEKYGGLSLLKVVPDSGTLQMNYRRYFLPEYRGKTVSIHYDKKGNLDLLRLPALDEEDAVSVKLSGEHKFITYRPSYEAAKKWLQLHVASPFEPAKLEVTRAALKKITGSSGVTESLLPVFEKEQLTLAAVQFLLAKVREADEALYQITGQVQQRRSGHRVIGRDHENLLRIYTSMQGRRRGAQFAEGLSKAEKISLSKKVTQGLRAQNLLIRYFLYSAVSAASLMPGWHHRFRQDPDLASAWVSAGVDVLRKSIWAYDPAYGTQFSSFVLMKMKYALSEMLSSEQPSQQVSDDLLPAIEPASPPEKEPPAAEIFQRLIEGLEKKDQQIFYLLLMEGLTQTQTAERLGIKQYQVSKRWLERIDEIGADPDRLDLLKILANPHLTLSINKRLQKPGKRSEVRSATPGILQSGLRRNLNVAEEQSLRSSGRKPQSEGGRSEVRTEGKAVQNIGFGEFAVMSGGKEMAFRQMVLDEDADLSFYFNINTDTELEHPEQTILARAYYEKEPGVWSHDLAAKVVDNFRDGNYRMGITMPKGFSGRLTFQYSVDGGATWLWANHGDHENYLVQRSRVLTVQGKRFRVRNLSMGTEPANGLKELTEFERLFLDRETRWGFTMFQALQKRHNVKVLAAYGENTRDLISAYLLYEVLDDGAQVLRTVVDPAFAPREILGQLWQALVRDAEKSGMTGILKIDIPFEDLRYYPKLPAQKVRKITSVQPNLEADEVYYALTLKLKEAEGERTAFDKLWDEPIPEEPFITPTGRLKAWVARQTPAKEADTSFKNLLMKYFELTPDRIRRVLGEELIKPLGGYQPTKVVLREMTNNDIDAVMAIEESSFEFPFRWSGYGFLVDEKGDDTKKNEKQGGGLADEEEESNFRKRVVAWADGKIVGYMVYKIFDERIDIQKVAVDPAYRFSTVGSDFMNLVKRVMKEQDKSFVSVEIPWTHLTAVRFFQRNGFSLFEEQNTDWEKKENREMVYWGPEIDASFLKNKAMAARHMLFIKKAKAQMAELERDRLAKSPQGVVAHLKRQRQWPWKNFENTIWQPLKNIKVTELAEKDLKSLLPFLGQRSALAWTLKDIREFIKKEGRVLLYRSNGRVMGFAALARESSHYELLDAAFLNEMTPPVFFNGIKNKIREWESLLRTKHVNRLLWEIPEKDFILLSGAETIIRETGFHFLDAFNNPASDSEYLLELTVDEFSRAEKMMANWLQGIERTPVYPEVMHMLADEWGLDYVHARKLAESQGIKLLAEGQMRSRTGKLIIPKFKKRAVKDVQIRWLIRRDMPEVLEIEKASWGQFALTEEEILSFLRQRNCIGMVAEAGNETLGYMIYELHKGRLKLLNLAVNPDERGQEVGLAMIEKLKDKLSQQRRIGITVEVRESNLGAQIFLKKLGFEAVNVLRDHYDDTHESAYQFEYVLPKAVGTAAADHLYDVADDETAGKNTDFDSAPFSSPKEPEISQAQSFEVWAWRRTLEELTIENIKQKFPDIWDPDTVLFPIRTRKLAEKLRELASGGNEIPMTLDALMRLSALPELQVLRIAGTLGLKIKGHHYPLFTTAPEDYDGEDIHNLELVDSAILDAENRWTYKNFSAAFANGDTQVRVIWNDNHQVVIGYALFRTVKKSVRILRLNVMLEHRLRGAEQALLKAVTDSALDEKSRNIVMKVSEDDLFMQAALRAEKFNAVKILAAQSGRSARIIFKRKFEYKKLSDSDILREVRNAVELSLRYDDGAVAFDLKNPTGHHRVIRTDLENLESVLLRWFRFKAVIDLKNQTIHWKNKKGNWVVRSFRSPVEIKEIEAAIFKQMKKGEHRKSGEKKSSETSFESGDDAAVRSEVRTNQDALEWMGTLKNENDSNSRHKAFQSLKTHWENISPEAREEAMLYALSDPDPGIRNGASGRLYLFRDSLAAMQQVLRHPPIYNGIDRDPRLDISFVHDLRMARHLARAAVLFSFIGSEKMKLALETELKTWDDASQESKLIEIYKRIPIGPSGIREAPLGVADPLTILEGLRLYEIWRQDNRRYEIDRIENPLLSKALALTGYLASPIHDTLYVDPADREDDEVDHEDLRISDILFKTPVLSEMFPVAAPLASEAARRIHVMAAPAVEIPSVNPLIQRSEVRSGIRRDYWILSNQGTAPDDMAAQILNASAELKTAEIPWDQITPMLEAGFERLRARNEAAADHWDKTYLPKKMPGLESALARLYRARNSQRIFVVDPIGHNKEDFALGYASEDAMYVTPGALSLEPRLLVQYLLRLAELLETETETGSPFVSQSLFPESQDSSLPSLGDYLNQAVLYGDFLALEPMGHISRFSKVDAPVILEHERGLLGVWNVPEPLKVWIAEALDRTQSPPTRVLVSDLLHLWILKAAGYPEVDGLLDQRIKTASGVESKPVMAYDIFKNLMQTARVRLVENTVDSNNPSAWAKQNQEGLVLARVLMRHTGEGLAALFRQALLEARENPTPILAVFEAIFQLQDRSHEGFSWRKLLWGFYLAPENAPDETLFFRQVFDQSRKTYYGIEEALPSWIFDVLKEPDAQKAARSLDLFYHLPWNDEMRRMIFEIMALIPTEREKAAAYAYLNTLFFGTDVKQTRQMSYGEDDPVISLLGPGLSQGESYVLAMRDMRRAAGTGASDVDHRLLWYSRELDDGAEVPGRNGQTWFSDYRTKIHSAFKRGQLETVQHVLEFLNTGDEAALKKKPEGLESYFSSEVSPQLITSFQTILRNGLEELKEQGRLSNTDGAFFLTEVLNLAEEDVIQAIKDANPDAPVKDVTKVELLIQLFMALREKFGAVSHRVRKELRDLESSINRWKLGLLKESFSRVYGSMIQAMDQNQTASAFVSLTRAREILRVRLLSQDLKNSDTSDLKLQEMLEFERVSRVLGYEWLPEIAQAVLESIDTGNLRKASRLSAVMGRFIYSSGFGGADFRDFLRELERGSLTPSELRDLVRALLNETRKAQKKTNMEMREALDDIRPNIDFRDLTLEIRAKVKTTKEIRVTNYEGQQYEDEVDVITPESRIELENSAVDEFIRKSGLPMLEQVLSKWEEKLRDPELSGQDKKIRKPRVIQSLDDYFLRFGQIYPGTKGTGIKEPRLLSLWSRKGLNLLRMAKKGVEVPPGVITSAELTFQPEIRNSPEFKAKVSEEVERLRQFSYYPDLKLLIYARSGSAFMMPGLMMTIPNLGMNDKEAAELAESTGDAWFAYDTYGELLRSFGINIFGIPETEFQEVFDVYKKDEATGEQMKEAVAGYQQLLAKHGKTLPESLIDQVMLAMENVYGSWDSETAKRYREKHELSDAWGTVVILQKGIFGNLKAGEANDISGVGAATLRSLPDGSEAVQGKFRIRSIGEQLMTRAENYGLLGRSQRIADEVTFEDQYPELYRQLTEQAQKLKQLFGYTQLFEFVIERGHLWVTQSNDDYQTDDFPELAEMTEEPLGRGHGVSGGAVRGWAATTLESAKTLLERFNSEKPAGLDGVILLVDRVNPEFISEIPQGVHLIAKTLSIHAETLAQTNGIAAIYGVNGMERDDAGAWRIGTQAITDGTVLTIDGHENPLVYHDSGKVFLGALPLKEEQSLRSSGRKPQSEGARSEVRRSLRPGLLTSFADDVVGKHNTEGEKEHKANSKKHDRIHLDILPFRFSENSANGAAHKKDDSSPTQPRVALSKKITDETSAQNELSKTGKHASQAFSFFGADAYASAHQASAGLDVRQIGANDSFHNVSSRTGSVKQRKQNARDMKLSQYKNSDKLNNRVEQSLRSSGRKPQSEGGRSEVRARPADYQGREALPILAQFVLRPTNHDFNNPEDRRLLAELVGKSAGETNTFGSFIFVTKTGFKQRWNVLGFNEEGYQGQIVSAESKGPFIEIKVRLTKESKDVMERVFQVGGVPITLRGAVKGVRQTFQTLDITDKLGAANLAELIRRPAGHAFHEDALRIAGLTGQRLGKTNSGGVLFFPVAKNFGYAWSILGFEAKDYEGTIVRAELKETGFEIEVELTKKDAPPVRRIFFVGELRKELSGNREKKEEKLSVREIMASQRNLRQGLDVLAELVMRPIGHDFTQDEDEIAGLVGHGFGTTGADGVIRFPPAPRYNYAWSAFNGPQSNGYHVKVIRAEAYRAFFEIELEFTKEGMPTVRRTFQAGAGITRLLQYTLSREEKKSRKPKLPPLPVYELSENLGRLALARLIKDPKRKDFLSEQAFLSQLGGLRIGPTNSAGDIPLTVADSFYYDLHALGFNASDYEGKIISAVARPHSFEVHLEMTKPDAEPVKRVLQAGSVTREIKGENKQADKKMTVLEFSDRLGLLLLGQLLLQPLRHDFATDTALLEQLEGLAIGDVNSAGVINFALVPNYLYVWHFGRQEAGYHAKIKIAALQSGFVRLLVELTKEDQSIGRIFQLGPSRKQLRYNRVDGVDTAPIVDVYRMLNFDFMTELAQTHSGEPRSTPQIVPYYHPAIVADRKQSAGDEVSARELWIAFDQLVAGLTPQDREIAYALADGEGAEDLALKTRSSSADISRVVDILQQGLQKFHRDTLRSEMRAPAMSLLKQTLEELKVAGDAARGDLDPAQKAQAVRKVAEFFKQANPAIRDAVYQTLKSISGVEPILLQLALEVNTLSFPRKRESMDPPVKPEDDNKLKLTFQSTSAEIAAGTVLTLGFILRAQKKSAEDRYAFREKWVRPLEALLEDVVGSAVDPKVRKARLMALGYLADEHSLPIFLQALDGTLQNKHEFDSEVFEAAAVSENAKLKEGLRGWAVKHAQEIPKNQIPLGLARLLNARWIAANLQTNSGQLLANRFGYLDKPLYQTLQKGSTADTLAIARELIVSLGVATLALVEHYGLIEPANRHDVLEGWKDFQLGLMKSLLTEEMAMLRPLRPVSTALDAQGQMERDLYFGALRESDWANAEDRRETPPFGYGYKEKHGGRFYYATRELFQIFWDKRVAKVKEVFGADVPEAMVQLLLPYYAVDAVAVETETRKEPREVAEAALLGRWRALSQLLEIHEGRLRIKSAAAKTVQLAVPKLRETSAELSNVAKVGAIISAVAGTRSAWKFAFLDPEAMEHTNLFIARIQRDSDWKTLSFGSRSALKLYAYDLLRDASRSNETIWPEWEARFKALAAEEKIARGVHPSIGMELQSVNVASSQVYLWKQALSFFDIPSPERLRYGHIVETAFRPAWTASAFLLALPILHRMGLMGGEKYKRAAAFHISLSGDLGAEARWLAFPLMMLGREKKEDEEELTIEEKATQSAWVLSKGYIHLNRENQKADPDSDAPQFHTEIRTARFANTEKGKDEILSDYEKFLPAVQYLGAALAAWKSVGAYGHTPLLADLWTRYQTALTVVVSEIPEAQSLMDADWYESTGDSKDPDLVMQLEIFKRMGTLYNYKKQNAQTYQAFTERVKALFLDYAEQARVLLNSASDPSARSEVRSLKIQPLYKRRGLTYKEALQWRTRIQAAKKGAFRGFWNHAETAKNFILIALDTVQGFREARDAGDIQTMAALYRKNVLHYEPRNVTAFTSYDKKTKKRKVLKGQTAFFYEVGGLRGLMSEKRYYLGDVTNSAAALLRFAIPGLIDVRNPNALQPLEVQVNYWSKPENARYHVLQALFTIPGFRQAHEQNDIAAMAEKYREYVLPYEAKGSSSVKEHGQTAFFLERGGLAGLFHKKQPYLTLAGSSGELLRLAIPGLVDDSNPVALKSREVERRHGAEANHKITTRREKGRSRLIQELEDFLKNPSVPSVSISRLLERYRSLKHEDVERALFDLGFLPHALLPDLYERPFRTLDSAARSEVRQGEVLSLEEQQKKLARFLWEAAGAEPNQPLHWQEYIWDLAGALIDSGVFRDLDLTDERVKQLAHFIWLAKSGPGRAIFQPESEQVSDWLTAHSFVNTTLKPWRDRISSEAPGQVGWSTDTLAGGMAEDKVETETSLDAMGLHVYQVNHRYAKVGGDFYRAVQSENLRFSLVELADGADHGESAMQASWFSQAVQETEMELGAPLLSILAENGGDAVYDRVREYLDVLQNKIDVITEIKRGKDTFGFYTYNLIFVDYEKGRVYEWRAGHHPAVVEIESDGAAPQWIQHEQVKGAAEETRLEEVLLPLGWMLEGVSLEAVKGSSWQYDNARRLILYTDGAWGPTKESYGLLGTVSQPEIGGQNTAELFATLQSKIENVRGRGTGIENDDVTFIVFDLEKGKVEYEKFQGLRSEVRQLVAEQTALDPADIALTPEFFAQLQSHVEVLQSDGSVRAFTSPGLAGFKRRKKPRVFKKLPVFRKVLMAYQDLAENFTGKNDARLKELAVLAARYPQVRFHIYDSNFEDTHYFEIRKLFKGMTNVQFQRQAGSVALSPTDSVVKNSNASVLHLSTQAFDTRKRFGVNTKKIQFMLAGPTRGTLAAALLYNPEHWLFRSRMSKSGDFWLMKSTMARLGRQWLAGFVIASAA